MKPVLGVVTGCTDCSRRKRRIWVAISGAQFLTFQELLRHLASSIVFFPHAQCKGCTRGGETCPQGIEGHITLNMSGHFQTKYDYFTVKVSSFLRSIPAVAYDGWLLSIIYHDGHCNFFTYFDISYTCHTS